MDGTRFDTLTKRLASGSSRRGLLKALAVGLLGGSTGHAGAAAAQRTGGQPNGTACATATDCVSRHCATGVCCDTPCTGQCESCATGTCSPVTGAPEAGRTPCPGAGPCQATCDGIGGDACAAFPGADTPCEDPTCADGWQTTYACAGNGTCAQATTACDPFGCNAEGTACASGCTSDADCAPGSYCAEDGQCQPDEGLGAPCAADTDCQHGVCVDDVCCVERCGACQVCNLPGNEGFCGPATDGGACDGGTCCGGECVDTASDVAHCGACDAACAGAVCQAAVCEAGVCGTEPMPDDTPCGEGQVCLDGACGCAQGLTACAGTCVDTQTDPAHCGDCTIVCPEASVCRMPGCAEGQCTTVSDPDQSGHTCADPVCVDGQQTTSTCDADGTCAATTTACGPYRCDAEGTACQTSCRDNNDCLGDAFCNAQGSCQRDKADGAACTDDAECVSGQCVDDICVAACAEGLTACDGECVDPQTDANHCGACGTLCVGQCCNGVCCVGLETCCDGFCCSGGQTCCGDTCCPLGESCCDGACQECCTAADCGANQVCRDGICQRCGLNYQPCCPPANTCVGELLCTPDGLCG